MSFDQRLRNSRDHHNGSNIPMTSEVDIPASQSTDGGEQPCSICLGKFIEPTKLDNCSHIFCFGCIRQWLRHSGATLCPMCKSAASFLIRTIPGKKHTERIDLQVLRDELNAEIRHERGNAVPLIDEKEILQGAVHHYRTMINHLENDGNRYPNKRSNTAREQKKRYEECVTEMNYLRLMVDQIDDHSITRGALVGNPKFRKLIYKFNAAWYEADPNSNANRRSFTTRVAREDETRHRERIVPWIRNELKLVLSRPNNAEGRQRLADEVFNTCLNHQIHSPHFRRALTSWSVHPRYCERFQHELFEFASSNLSMKEFFCISAYRLVQSRRPVNNNFSVGGLHGVGNGEDAPTVVDIADDNEDVILIDGAQDSGDALHPRMARNESNYIRDISISSGTGSDDEGRLYMRRSCRLPAIPNVRHEHPFAGNAGGIGNYGRWQVNSDGLPIRRTAHVPAFNPASYDLRRGYASSSDFRRQPRRVHNEPIALSSGDEQDEVTYVGERRDANAFSRLLAPFRSRQDGLSISSALTASQWLNSNPNAPSSSSSSFPRVFERQQNEQYSQDESHPLQRSMFSLGNGKRLLRDSNGNCSSASIPSLPLTRRDIIDDAWMPQIPEPVSSSSNFSTSHLNHAIPVITNAVTFPLPSLSDEVNQRSQFSGGNISSQQSDTVSMNTLHVGDSSQPITYTSVARDVNQLAAASPTDNVQESTLAVTSQPISDDIVVNRSASSRSHKSKSYSKKRLKRMEETLEKMTSTTKLKKLSEWHLKMRDRCEAKLELIRGREDEDERERVGNDRDSEERALSRSPSCSRSSHHHSPPSSRSSHHLQSSQSSRSSKGRKRSHGESHKRSKRSATKRQHD